MPTLTIYRGISGSGKSTDARNRNAVVVSRDEIRTALFGAGYHSRTPDRDSEELVTKVEHLAIAEHLAAGKDVISDNTNLRPKFAQAIADIGYRLGAEVEVVLFDVPADKAWHRNLQRAQAGGRLVPRSVIDKQVQQLKNTRNWQPVPPYIPRPYSGTPGKPKAFLVDIDGTLAHMNGKRGPFEWHNVGLDDVDEAVSDVVRSLFWSEDGPQRWTVIVMSGRDASCREQTEEWLELHDIPFDHLFMRPAGDMRKDNIIKGELFDNHVRDNFDVQFVIDDRRQVVDMWLTMGLKVFNVAGLDGGNF